ncbi:leucyl aminopeptidase [Sphaerotilus uruguayifluvii]|uniref:Probable cytosol aminopeptidase n=1 Tax=Sphaerotilus uruguayifluvii TaxID=2735897 RepID=A0ABX2G103_9BURK|nr:leucyl aminopeptidase [Leptothrix sp. C29]NRT55981.1 leucyl aminopeptidase [Leptothrix sp. C29]
MDVRTLVAASQDYSELDREALVVVVPADQAAWRLDGALRALLDDAVAQGDLALKPGRTLYVHRPAGLKAARLAVAVAADGGARAWKKAVAAALGLIKGGGATRAALLWAGAGEPDAAMAEAAACVAADLVYVYRLTKPSAPEAPRLGAVELVCAAAAEAAVAEGLARGAAIAAGVELAREVANRPANHCTPSHLADEARALAKTKGVKAEILDRKEIEALGMGSFLAVAKGSEEPPRFIVLKYQGAGKKDAPVVLVGKGITFDTGGISIKPAGDMDEMKFDMGGAASVLGTFRAVAALRPKVNLIGLIPTCENMPDGRAVKPGDVVTSMSGQTIEILNTDAEGRLILCDALTYAERFKPAAVVDIATLTGACIIALGHHHAGLFSPDDALADTLLAAGRAAQDTAWRMPLDEEYDEALKSNFADVPNVGPRAGGSITAAKFLQRFAKAYRWAHLDVAGVAFRSGAAKGGTGRPVPLLTHFVLSQAK